MIPPILLSAIVFLSAIAALVALAMPDATDDQRGRVRIVGLFTSGVQLFITLAFGVFVQIGLAEGGGQASANEESHSWFSSFSFSSGYHLTADGISLVLLVLTTALFFSIFFQAWRVREHVRLYVVLVLLLETAVNGVLCASDYMLFLLFWGLTILPLYVLLRVFGGAGRSRAAARYLAFALTSYALLALAVVLVIVRAGQHSSDLTTDFTALPGAVSAAGFWLTLAAFGIALGAFPVHRWLIEAQSEASPGIAALLTGVVSKLGAYGLMRVAVGQFPAAAHQYSLVIVGLGVVGAIWGALGALAQDDVRRVIGYSNLAQVSLLVLAAGAQTSVALVGAVLFMVAQGLGVGMLILLMGVVEERARVRSIRGLGGLVAAAPRLAVFWWLGVFTVIGVPLLAGFSAFVMLFSGAFPAHRIATVLVLASLVVTTGALLLAGQRIFFGPLRETLQRLRDIGTLDLMYLIPIAAVIVLFGVRPGAFTPLITNGVIQITTRLSGG
ncbi:MAG TPA: NADH-quinone oxidoreductase subunit M [Candidatus Dormibacteraeota bacterium]